MHAKTNKLLLGDLILFAFEIGFPVMLLGLTGVFMLAAPVSVPSILNVPFYDWSTILCAAWVLLVLNGGPFLVPRVGKSRAEE